MGDVSMVDAPDEAYHLSLNDPENAFYNVLLPVPTAPVDDDLLHAIRIEAVFSNGLLPPSFGLQDPAHVENPHGSCEAPIPDDICLYNSNMINGLDIHHEVEKALRTPHATFQELNMGLSDFSSSISGNIATTVEATPPTISAHPSSTSTRPTANAPAASSPFPSGTSDQPGDPSTSVTPLDEEDGAKRLSMWKHGMSITVAEKQAVAAAKAAVRAGKNKAKVYGGSMETTVSSLVQSPPGVPYTILENLIWMPQHFLRPASIVRALLGGWRRKTMAKIMLFVRGGLTDAKRLRSTENRLQKQFAVGYNLYYNVANFSIPNVEARAKIATENKEFPIDMTSGGWLLREEYGSQAQAKKARETLRDCYLVDMAKGVAPDNYESTTKTDWSVKDENAERLASGTGAKSLALGTKNTAFSDAQVCFIHGSLLEGECGKIGVEYREYCFQG
ncbi:hypothetical protein MBLNU230_g5078t1 [Neophaeotheca triangularis]